LARLLVGTQLGGGNLIDLKTKQIQLLRVSPLVHDQRRFLRLQLAATRRRASKLAAQTRQPRESVKNIALPQWIEQRLMIMRPVHIDEFPSQAGQRLQRGRRTIDELAICPRNRENPLQNQLIVRAWLDAVFIEQRLHDLAQRALFKHRFHRAIFAAASDQVPVRALAQNKMERADNDRFARSRFTGDGGVTAVQRQGEIGYQRQIFDPQRAEHGRRILTKNIRGFLTTDVSG
jgi:hypothetical protein